MVMDKSDKEKSKIEAEKAQEDSQKEEDIGNKLKEVTELKNGKSATGPPKSINASGCERSCIQTANGSCLNKIEDLKA